MRSYATNSLACMLLIALSMVVFGASLNAFFGADDYLWLEGNSFTEVVGYFSSSWGHGNAFRPLVRASFAINAAISGDSPFGWHLTNILIHSLNSILVFLITKFLICSYDSKMARRQSNFGVLFIPLIAALLFLTAPNININVTWISARTHSLASLFFLLGLYLWMQKTNNWLALCCFIAAVASYESMAVFPLFLAGLLVIDSGEKGGYQSIFKMREEVTYLLVMTVVLAIFLIYRTYVLSIYTVEVGNSATDIPTAFSNLIALYEIVFKANRWLIVSFILVMARALYLKKHRASVFLILIGGLVLLAPFALADGAANRFTYLVTAYLSASACILLYVFFRDSKKMMIVVMVIFLMGISRGINKNLESSQDSKIAGTMATQILDELANGLKYLPDNREVFIVGIPAKYKRSWVHATYFDVALKKHMGEDENNAVIFWDFHLMNAPSGILKASADDDFYLYGNEGLRQVTIDVWKNSPEVIAMKL